METEVLQRVYEDEDMFKSYYVVWKPYVMKYIVKEFAKFKSYYVVWKPEYQQ